MKHFYSIVFMAAMAFQPYASADSSRTTRVVVMVSGGAAVSPFTTPARACKTGYAAGNTDSFLRQYLLERHYQVFTAPAMAGYGKVVTDAGDDMGPFGDCPKPLPDYMTVNSTGDIQLAGVHLANFVNYLGRKYGVRQVNFVAHSMGGLYARSAIHYLKETGSKIRVRSLTTLGTPWEGAPFSNRTDPNDPYSGCDDQPICKQMLDVFADSAPIILAETTRTQMAALNEYLAGVLTKIPVTLIAGNAFTKQGGVSSAWPNDGIVNLASALAQQIPDSVINHRRCYLYEEGTHSLWISTHADPKRPEAAAITWNDTVGAWVDRALREANVALKQPNREGCPAP